MIERCLAKDPGQRPTATGLLAAVGALQPAGDWLPDTLTRPFAANAAPASLFGLSRPGAGASRPGFAPAGGPVEIDGDRRPELFAGIEVGLQRVSD